MKDHVDSTPHARRDWMGLLARAPSDALLALWRDYRDQPVFEWLRKPEVGGIMVRGRTGATGAPFNLGEMTVTRCSVKIGDGTVGHGYVQGRSKQAAQAAALIDALMQTAAADAVTVQIIAPLQDQADAARTRRAAKAAATKVEFFTLARGED